MLGGLNKDAEWMWSEGFGQKATGDVDVTCSCISTGEGQCGGGVRGAPAQGSLWMNSVRPLLKSFCPWREGDGGAENEAMACRTGRGLGTVASMWFIWSGVAHFSVDPDGQLRLTISSMLVLKQRSKSSSTASTHLQAWQKCRLSGPTVDLLPESLHLHRILRQPTCTLKLEDGSSSQSVVPRLPASTSPWTC